MEMFFEVGDEVIWGILGGGLIFLISLIWIEFKKSKPWFLARCIALFFLVVSICLLVLKPSFPITIENAVALLITEGSDPATIDSLENALSLALIVDLRVKNQQEEVIEQLQSYDQWLITGAKVPLQLLPFLEKKQVHYYPNGFISGRALIIHQNSFCCNLSWMTL